MSIFFIKKILKSKFLVDIKFSFTLKGLKLIAKYISKYFNN